MLISNSELVQCIFLHFLPRVVHSLAFLYHNYHLLANERESERGNNWSQHHQQQQKHKVTNQPTNFVSSSIFLSLTLRLVVCLFYSIRFMASTLSLSLRRAQEISSEQWSWWWWEREREKMENAMPCYGLWQANTFFLLSKPAISRCLSKQYRVEERAKRRHHPTTNRKTKHKTKQVFNFLLFFVFGAESFASNSCCLLVGLMLMFAVCCCHATECSCCCCYYCCCCCCLIAYLAFHQRATSKQQPNNKKRRKRRCL